MKHDTDGRGKDTTTSVIPKEDLQSAASNNTIKGVLTRVYKFFMVSYGKDRMPVWNKLMDNYVNDPNNNISSFRSKRTSVRGNMKREYLGPQLSWPKFCEAMSFSKFKSLEIIFIAEDENGERMMMREELNFDTIPDSDFGEDIVDTRVSPMTDKDIEVDAKDAREAVSRHGKPIKTTGKDWASRPNSEVQSIIDNNIVK